MDAHVENQIYVIAKYEHYKSSCLCPHIEDSLIIGLSVALLQIPFHWEL